MTEGPEWISIAVTAARLGTNEPLLCSLLAPIELANWPRPPKTYGIQKHGGLDGLNASFVEFVELFPDERKHHPMKSHSFSALAGAFALLAFASRPAAAQYTLTDLGSDLHPLALNNQGQVLGYTGTLNTGFQLYLVTNGSRQFISDYSPGRAAFLNNAGQVATIDGSKNAFLYSNGMKYILENSTVDGPGIAGLSDNGYGVWYNYTTGHNYLYHEGVKQDFGSYTVGSVNNKGQVVARGPGSQGYGGIYLYENGVWRLLYDAPSVDYYDALNGPTTMYRSITPLFITDDGDVFITIGPIPDYIEALQNDGGFVRYSTVTNTVTANTVPTYGPNGGSVNLEFFNQRGDCAGSFQTEFYDGQVIPVVFTNEKYTELAARSTFPFYSRYPSGDVQGLNNRSHFLYSIYSASGGLPSYFLTTTKTVDLNTLFAPLGLKNVSIGFNIVGVTNKTGYLNDMEQLLISSAGHTYLATPSGKVTGKVQLEGIAASAPAQTLTFQFRDTTDYPLFTKTASVGPDGNFTLTGIADGTYNVWVKGPKNLAKVATATVTNAGIGSLSVTLPGGDADNSNAIDLNDFGILVNAFGSAVNDGSGNYDPTADFNYDGVVDIADFGLLVNNYGMTGDL